jgi:hypothetical protein
MSRIPGKGETIHTTRFSKGEYTGVMRYIDEIINENATFSFWNVFDTRGMAYEIFWDAESNEWKERTGVKSTSHKR